MIQQQVQLDGSFGAPKLRPVIKGGAQIDDGRVETEQLVLEAKLASPAVGQLLTTGQQFQEHRFDTTARGDADWRRPRSSAREPSVLLNA